MYCFPKVLIKFVVLFILSSLTNNAVGLNFIKVFNQNKYIYQASESAPLGFPMKMTSGEFIYHDENGFLSVSSMATVANGWGYWRSSHVTTEKYRPLPSKLSLTYFSFVEDT